MRFSRRLTLASGCLNPKQIFSRKFGVKVLFASANEAFTTEETLNLKKIRIAFRSNSVISVETNRKFPLNLNISPVAINSKTVTFSAWANCTKEKHRNLVDLTYKFV